MKLIRSIQNADLTRQQQKIADYFVKNQNRVCTMSLIKVAREIGVSDASVVRFARAIGYKGFSDLKAELYENVTEDLSKTNVGEYDLSQRFDIQTERYKSLDLSVELTKLLLNNVERSLQQNSHDKYEKIVDVLYGAKRVFLVGLRGAKGNALQFGRLLSYLMDDVHVVTNGEDEAVAQLQSLTDQDVVLSISYARYFKIDKVLADLFKRQSSFHCAITDSVSSPLAKSAELICLVETQHMAFSNSTVGTMAVLEYLLTLLCWKYSAEYQERLTERDRLLRSLREQEQ